MARFIVGIIFIVALFVEVHIYTKMFGNNWFPTTPEEVLLDLISLIASMYVCDRFFLIHVDKK